MSNGFYGAFDFEALPGARPVDYRTPFQIDRDRVLHSSAFRKLQSKTQVFLSGEYDFYRTRLTHSIEVAQIGRSICQFLRTVPGGPLREDFHIDGDLVEAVCLAHDLGHPPFGHAGERVLHDCMAGHGGFEGNAQTLRLLTSIIYTGEESGTRGLAPTRAFMDGVLKYKSLRSEVPDAGNHFIYDEQRGHREFVLGGGMPGGVAAGPALDAFRSVECQIMDWADDTAYSLNDVIDGVRAGFVTWGRIESWAARGGACSAESEVWIRSLAEAMRHDRLEPVFGNKIGHCIRACRLIPWENPLASLSHRYAWRLEIDGAVGREIAFYKALAADLIFTSPQIGQMEHKGRFILEGLFAAFVESLRPGRARALRVLPPLVERLLSAEPTEAGRMRRICDHIAGLTDGQARRAWKRLYDPDHTSIVDLG